MVRSKVDERMVALGILALSIVSGLAVPRLATWCEPIALPSLLLVVIFSLVPFATIDRAELTSVNPDVWRILAWQQIALPCLVISLGIIGRFPDSIISLMIVTACSGALFASPALASLLDLDRRSALQCMVLSTLAMPFSMYGFLSAFKGTTASLDLQTYAVRVLIFLMIPAVAFFVYRIACVRISGPSRSTVEAFARWAVIASLAVFGIGMMRSVSEQLAASPVQVLFYFLLTATMCLAMLTMTTIVMYRFGPSEALTAAILSGFRNVGLGYALVGDMLGPELSVFVGVSLLPIFTAPLFLKMLADYRNRQRSVPAGA